MRLADLLARHSGGFLYAMIALATALGACAPGHAQASTPTAPNAPLPAEPSATSQAWRSPTPPPVRGTPVYTPPGLYPPHTPGATYAPLRSWSDVLEFTPFPYATPLPAEERTPIDGVYSLHDPSEPQWWRCARCPDFLPGGGNWRLHLDRGTLHLFYEVTGFATVSSYALDGQRLFLFNDPHCLYDVGEYTWHVEGNALVLEEVQDSCAIHMRAVNLTRQAWVSCQPPNREAAISDHWIRPAGCEDLG